MKVKDWSSQKNIRKKGGNIVKQEGVDANLTESDTKTNRNHVLDTGIIPLRREYSAPDAATGGLCWKPGMCWPLARAGR